MHPLKKYLMESGQKQVDFAAKLQTSPVYLSHIIAGRKIPGDDMVEAIVRASGGLLSYRDLKPDKAKQLDRIKNLEAEHA